MTDHIAMLEELAILLWHRFAPDDHIEWEDETHKAEYRDVAEAAIALMRVQSWQPIESAPKEDGLKILGASNAPWTQDYYPVLVYEGYRHGRNKQYFGWQAPFDHDDRAPDPTHWMPLPAPPASQDQEGGK